MLANKNCEMIHNLALSIFCCRAGTTSDCYQVTKAIYSELEVHRLSTKSENRVEKAASRLSKHAFKYGVHIFTHLIAGGHDC